MPCLAPYRPARTASRALAVGSISSRTRCCGAQLQETGRGALGTSPRDLHSDIRYLAFRIQGEACHDAAMCGLHGQGTGTHTTSVPFSSWLNWYWLLAILYRNCLSAITEAAVLTVPAGSATVHQGAARIWSGWRRGSRHTRSLPEPRGLTPYEVVSRGEPNWLAPSSTPRLRSTRARPRSGRIVDRYCPPRAVTIHDNETRRIRAAPAARRPGCGGPAPAARPPLPRCLRRPTVSPADELRWDHPQTIRSG